MPAPKNDGSRPLNWRDFLLAFAICCVVVLPGLWAYTLIDPWEGHYAEVARRMLADQDWIHLHWQAESFRSKPALTPWLIASSLRLHGLASGGGFSGELLVSPAYTAWAVRLPFALCGIAGMMSLWFATARLVSRRAALIALMVLATMPFYYLVARQAITDMPMVAATSSAMCFFMLALHDGDRPLRRLFWRVCSHHVLLLFIMIVALAQLAYNCLYFAHHPALGPGMLGRNAQAWVTLPSLGASVLLLLCLVVWPLRSMRGFYLLCAYSLLGLSVLAKGPPGVLLAVFVCSVYLVSTRRWRQLLRLRILEGAALIVLIALPWHVAMALCDGQAFLVEYVGYHWLQRATSGAHMVNAAGEGSFSYYARQLGYGLWPFMSVLPASLLAAWRSGYASKRQGLQVFALLWALCAFVLFSMIKTKFHHYVLPAVPGFALLVALWLDKVWTQEIAGERVALAFGILLCALIGYDVLCHQDRFIELFVYRYDRPWPLGEPWRVDLRLPIGLFAGLFVLVAIWLLWIPKRGRAIVCLLLLAAGFSTFLGNVYMPAAGPHWGQGQLHASYYEQRQLYGITLRYALPGDMRAAWPIERQTIDLATMPSSVLQPGASLTLRLLAPETLVEVHTVVTKLHKQSVSVRIDDLGWRLRLPAQSLRSARQPEEWVDADPLIAWNLHWRSELFWSGGELWSQRPSGHRMFEQGHDDEFMALLASEEFAGRSVYIITEVSQGNRLRSLLPAHSKESLRLVDASSNKFSLYRFRR